VHAGLVIFQAARDAVLGGAAGMDRQHSMERRTVKKEEMAKVEAFLRKRFSNPAIEVRARPKKTDSAEVYIGKRDEDFLAVLYREDEEGEVSYQFQMAILDIDLEDA
jgi:hypothetical protein